MSGSETKKILAKGFPDAAGFIYYATELKTTKSKRTL
jgi:hypothetical protein